MVQSIHVLARELLPEMPGHREQAPQNNTDKARQDVPAQGLSRTALF
jgi:hypothetical protein